MAIKCNGEYYRLISGEVNYPNNTVFATFDLYKQESDRLREKALLEDVNTLKSDILAKMQDEVSLLGKYVKDTYNLDINDISDGEKFLQQHSDVAQKANILNEMQAESLTLRDDLLIKDININKLKYKDVWVELGLTEEMCKKINYDGRLGMALSGLTEYTAASIYTEAKKSFVDVVEDC